MRFLNCINHKNTEKNIAFIYIYVKGLIFRFWTTFLDELIPDYTQIGKKNDCLCVVGDCIIKKIWRWIWKHHKVAMVHFFSLFVGFLFNSFKLALNALCWWFFFSLLSNVFVSDLRQFLQFLSFEGFSKPPTRHFSNFLQNFNFFLAPSNKSKYYLSSNKLSASRKALHVFFPPVSRID